MYINIDEYASAVFVVSWALILLPLLFSKKSKLAKLSPYLIFPGVILLVYSTAVGFLQNYWLAVVALSIVAMITMVYVIVWITKEKRK